jgi:hypothetical protein
MVLAPNSPIPAEGMAADVRQNEDVRYTLALIHMGGQKDYGNDFLLLNGFVLVIIIFNIC